VVSLPSTPQITPDKRATPDSAATSAQTGTRPNRARSRGTILISICSWHRSRIHQRRNVFGPPEWALDAMTRRRGRGPSRPVLHKPGAPDNRIRYGTRKPARSSPIVWAKGFGRHGPTSLVIRPSSVVPKSMDMPGVPEVDRRHLGALLDARHREFPLHLVCHHLNTGYTRPAARDTSHLRRRRPPCRQTRTAEFSVGRLSIDIGGRHLPRGNTGGKASRLQER